MLYARVHFGIAVVALGLLAPLSAGAQSGSAYPFRDASTIRECIHGRSTECVAGAKATRDGTFAIDERVRSPLGGRMPTSAYAYSAARFNLEDYVTPRGPSVTYRVTLALGRAESIRVGAHPDLNRATQHVDPDRSSGTGASSHLEMSIRDTSCGCYASGRAFLIDTREDRYAVDDIVVLDVKLDGAQRESTVGGWITVDVSVGGRASLGSEGPIQGDTGSISQMLSGSVVVERIA